MTLKKYACGLGFENEVSEIQEEPDEDEDGINMEFSNSIEKEIDLEQAIETEGL